MRHRNRAKRNRYRPAAGRVADFERVVEEALAALPEELRAAIDNLGILIEDEPPPDLLAELGYDPDEALFGLYVGVPLPERSYGEAPCLPDHILIFRGPLQRLCRTPAELRQQIRITVLHELAHYFGFDEDDMRRLGLE